MEIVTFAKLNFFSKGSKPPKWFVELDLHEVGVKLDLHEGTYFLAHYWRKEHFPLSC